MALPTATEVRDLLEGYDITTSVLSDAWLNDERDNMVVPYVNRITRQVFDTTKQVTEFYSGTGSTILYLNRRPILTLDEIIYVNSPPSLVTLDLTSILVMKQEGLLKSRTNFQETHTLPIFFKGTNNIQVKYTFGFATIPPEVSRAMKFLLAGAGLGQIAARTGGGSLGVQAFNRNYGNRDKYSNIRADFDRKAHALLRPFMTAMVGQ